MPTFLACLQLSGLAARALFPAYCTVPGGRLCHDQPVLHRAVPQGRTINDWMLHACISQLQV